MSRKAKLLAVTLLSVVAVGVIAFLVTKGLRIYCLFNLITGLNCAGCGNTRAAFALLRLDFGAMLHYNLFFPLEIAYIFRVYFVCAKNYLKSGKVFFNIRPSWIDISFLILLVVWTVVRNVTPLY